MFLQETQGSNKEKSSLTLKANESSHRDNSTSSASNRPRTSSGNPIKRSKSNVALVPVAVRRAALEPRNKKRAGGSTYKGSYPDRLRDPDLHSGSSFRLQEMVWVALLQPILDTRPGSTSSITHWPALVLSRDFRTRSTLEAPLVPGRPAQLDTTQVFVYQVQLLACSNEFKVWQFVADRVMTSTYVTRS